MADNKKWFKMALLPVAVLAVAAAWWTQRDSGSKPPAAADPSKSTQMPGGSGGANAAPMPAVEVAKVQTLQLIDDAQAVGTLTSRQRVVLRPEVAGRITAIAFADGAAVRAGQLLFQLDDALQRAELSQAEAQLSIAKANLKRNEELVAQGFVAQRVLDESRASLQVAQAQVQLNEARLGRMRIVAPFSGTVGIRSVNLGDYVKDGAELVSLDDTSALNVDFRLPERYQARVSKGQSVDVTFDALPSQAFKARVEAVEPMIVAEGRALMVRASLPPTQGAALRPGLFARIKLVMGIEESALMVPEEAVVPQGNRQFVYRIVKDPQDKGTTAQKTEVKLGARRAGAVQVIEGLAADDTVVRAGQQRLKGDSSAVRIVEL